MENVLFTRQRHEADRAGLHWDYRIVVGNKALSWATKKELPEAGKSIILWEQPVHTAQYSLSSHVIPKGNYGSGLQTLEFVRKAKLHPDSTPEHIKFTTSQGESFLIKKMDFDKYGEGAWLFRRIETPGMEKKANKYLKYIMNKYLIKVSSQLEKEGGKPLAVIIKGNPKYLDQNKDISDKFYNNIAARLESKGYRVEFDAGEAYTTPNENASVWIAHSRGSSRLQFAPKNVKAFEVKTKSYEGNDPNHYELSSDDIANINGIKPVKVVDIYSSSNLE